MNEINQLHNKAMDFAEQAFELKKKFFYQQANDLFKAAYELESQAALKISAIEKNEPSRSIIFRSAASLALNANLLDEAEKMIAYGFIGFPPKEIAHELRELFLKIYEIREQENIAA